MLKDHNTKIWSKIKTGLKMIIFNTTINLFILIISCRSSFVPITQEDLGKLR